MSFFSLLQSLLIDLKPKFVNNGLAGEANAVIANILAALLCSVC